MSKTCKWKYRDMWKMWETGCGEPFAVKDKNMTFCPYCGGKIEVADE